jgi:DNA repair protein RecN (Recombination protein N)
MLTDLYIENLMLIEEAHMEMGGKFLVITGESGSGKSSLMEALKLALGAKSSSDLIRRGQEMGQVRASFDLSGLESLTQKRLEALFHEQGLSWDPTETLVIQRQIFTQKASKSLVACQAASQNFLQKLGLELVEIVDAGASFTLEHPETHLECLDAFAGNEELKENALELWQKKQELLQKLQEIQSNSNQKENLISLLEHQVEEIQKGLWKPDEEHALLHELERLSRFEQTLELLQQAHQEISSSSLQKISRLISSLDKASGYDERLIPIAECIRGALVQSQEAQDLIEPLLLEVEEDPERVKHLEARLEEIHKLKKKYGNDPELVLKHMLQAQEKLTQIQHLEAQQEKLETELEATQKQLLALSNELSQRRQTHSTQLEKQVEAVLKDLNMPHASFSIEVHGKTLGPTGSDHVEFFLCPNPGEPKRSVRKFASGGEMARLFMALKTLKAHKRIPPTLIFDEIDSNIGGESAVRLAHKFKEMSRSRQVICITHFAQVAKEAQLHLVTEKRVENDRTLAKIRHLTAPKEKELELKRMMGQTLKPTAKA